MDVCHDIRALFDATEDTLWLLLDLCKSMRRDDRNYHIDAILYEHRKFMCALCDSTELSLAYKSEWPNPTLVLLEELPRVHLAIRQVLPDCLARLVMEWAPGQDFLCVARSKAQLLRIIDAVANAHRVSPMLPQCLPPSPYIRKRGLKEAFGSFPTPIHVQKWQRWEDQTRDIWHELQGVYASVSARAVAQCESARKQRERVLRDMHYSRVTQWPGQKKIKA